MEFRKDNMSEYCKNCYELQEQLYQLKAGNDELNKQIEILTMQLESLNEKFSRKRAVIEFADCPSYSYGDNTLEPTCTKNFCYDVKSCDNKNMVKYKQTLAEIKEIAEVEIECKTYEIENDCFNETRCKALNEHIDFIKQILQKISECEVNSDNE